MVIYGPSSSCSSTWTASACCPTQVVNSSELSNGDSVHTGEPLPYQFEPQLSPEGDNTPVDVPNEVHIRQFGPYGPKYAWTKQEFSIALLL